MITFKAWLRSRWIRQVEAIIYWTIVLTILVYGLLMFSWLGSPSDVAGGMISMVLALLIARLIDTDPGEPMGHAPLVVSVVFYAVGFALLTTETWNLSYALGITLGCMIIDLLFCGVLSLTARIIDRLVPPRRKSPPETEILPGV